MGRITSRGCGRNVRITLDFVSCGLNFPSAADPTDQVTKVMHVMSIYKNVYLQAEPKA